VNAPTGQCYILANSELWRRGHSRLRFSDVVNFGHDVRSHNGELIRNAPHLPTRFVGQAVWADSERFRRRLRFLAFAKRTLRGRRLERLLRLAAFRFRRAVGGDDHPPSGDRIAAVLGLEVRCGQASVPKPVANERFNTRPIAAAKRRDAVRPHHNVKWNFTDVQLFRNC
jgi:hypothetical protein